jgi:hypothetical protein
VHLLRIRADLDGAHPPIWRRIELRGDLTLDRVHDVLQTAFGWTNSHLHAFQMGPVRDYNIERFLTDFDVEEGDEGVLESDVRLDQVLCEVGDRLFYEYDFGDSWDHTLQLEAIAPYDDGQPAARVLAGRRACPPEDCGGVPGYEEVLEALVKPASERHHELLDWLPVDYDPEDFDLADTNDAVQAAIRLSTTGVLPEALAEPFADLVRRTPWARGFALPDLVAKADVRDATLPDEPARVAMVRPLLVLLDMVGDDGLLLTQAGYLKPATVVELTGVLELDAFWGKRNREEHVLPVAQLRATAQALGLVRKHKGRLVRSPAGRRTVGDPDGVWDLVVEALPFGKQPVEQHAGVVALLAAAADLDPYDVLDRTGSRILDEAGWQTTEGPLEGWHALELARPTIDALSTLSGLIGIGREPVVPAGDLARLARACLRT